MGLEGISLVVELAHEYSLETRIRRLVEEYAAAGTPARTIVLSPNGVSQLADETYRWHRGSWTLWSPDDGAITEVSMSYLGLPILVKDFVADGEVLIGV